MYDKNGSRDVHGVDQHQAFFYAAFPKGCRHIRGDIDKGPAGGDFKEEFFTK